jgi:hypothetical protein
VYRVSVARFFLRHAAPHDAEPTLAHRSGLSIVAIVIATAVRVVTRSSLSVCGIRPT